MRQTLGMSFAVVALVGAGTLGAGGSAAAAGTEVTRGGFHTFAAGTTRGYQIAGRAQMVRRADGTTLVTVHVEGLTPGLTYPSHVHREACATDNADGHYKFPTAVDGGGSPAGNEIWPGPITADGGGIANGNTVVGAVAGPEAASVVVHDPDGAKIACADLTS